MDMQDGWRWCNQCYGLAYNGFGRGECLGDEGHNLSTSGPYLLPFNTTPDGTQPGWRWCDRCQSLAYADGEPGPCFAGGTHTLENSAAYSVPYDHVPPGAQEGWRWCTRCQLLWFAGGGHGGTCTRGGKHDPTGSFAYSVPTPASIPVVVRPEVAVSTVDGWLSVSGNGFTPRGAVHLTFIADGKQVVADTTANDAGRILHSEPGRRGDGACMIIIRDEATGKFTADRSSVLHPVRIPLDPVRID